MKIDVPAGERVTPHTKPLPSFRVEVIEVAMTVKEIKEWLATVDDDKMVAVDDGGLTLVVKGEESYLEVGGIPVIEGSFDDEPGWEMHA